MERHHLGVRKGAWTGEEDDLLRQCIEKHGEGKWHQVPYKAGLNRCRKSCRIRWLNYLKPDIKRGEFTEDEVDLMLRLHKLLGNRWSMIAGRLPGRTGSDVKNYWNTRIRSKISSEEKTMKEKCHHEIIKPVTRRPRLQSSKNSLCLSDEAVIGEDNQLQNDFSGLLPTPQPIGSETDCWKTLLDEKDSSLGIEEDPFTNFWVEDMVQLTKSCAVVYEEDKSESNFSFVGELWHF